MPPRKEKDPQLTRAKRDESEIDIVEPVTHIKQEEGLLDEDNMPSLVNDTGDEVLEDEDEDGEDGEDGEDCEYGDEEMEMYDPTQVLGEIFVILPDKKGLGDLVVNRVRSGCSPPPPPLHACMPCISCIGAPQQGLARHVNNISAALPPQRCRPTRWNSQPPRHCAAHLAVAATQSHSRRANWPFSLVTHVT